MEDYEVDDAYNDEDDKDEDETGRRQRKREGIFKRLQSRIGGSRRFRKDDDSAASSNSSRSSDNSFPNNPDENNRGGFLKRRFSKITSFRKKEKILLSSEQRRQSERSVPQRSFLRRSVHKSHGTIVRSKASRSLGLSIAIDGDTDDGDLAMPLRNSQGKKVPTVIENNNNNRKGRAPKSGPTTALTNENDNKSHKISYVSSPGGSRQVTRTVKGRRRTRSRRQTQDAVGSVRVVDSVPSVASMDKYSTDRRPYQEYHDSLHRSFPRDNGRNSSRARRSRFAREPDSDMNGFRFDADLYCQSLPWIVKSWIYFVTVLTPLGFCYYIFVSIGSSTSLHHYFLLQKVSISNLLFVGLSCTWRTNFWAKQALDTHGGQSILGRGGGGVSNNDILRNHSRLKTTPAGPPSSTDDGGGDGRRYSRGSKRTLSAVAGPSVWDVEKFLESTRSSRRQQTGMTPAQKRPKFDKHASINEMYEFHEADEKVAMFT